jgi:SAM-dependent methyltransferase
MAERDWNDSYATGNLPWDTGIPDENLVELVEAGTLAPGRVLEIGCGTGTNALWLAQKSFDVLGVDLAPLAIEKARDKSAARDQSAGAARFEVLDFLAARPDGAPFDLVFDRGCFHVFDEADQRARFAERVAELLAPNGMWLSLVGSTEGAPRDMGPPRRSARDLAAAIEPSLELVTLRAARFDPNSDTPLCAWVCLSRKREQPAQPSTRR